MRWWLAAGIVGALVGLLFARFLDGPAWVDALVFTGGCLGLIPALALGMIVRRRWPRQWLAIASLLLATAAAAARATLLAQLESRTMPQIAFWRLTLAASSVVWGAMALIWGALAISDALQRRQGRWPPLLGAGVAVTLSLYSLAPLWSALGLRINHWTVVGLFGLAATAYAIGALYRRLVPPAD